MNNWRATVDTFRTFLAGAGDGTQWLEPGQSLSDQ
jgi:hypothetical protein